MRLCSSLWFCERGPGRGVRSQKPKGPAPPPDRITLESRESQDLLLFVNTNISRFPNLGGVGVDCKIIPQCQRYERCSRRAKEEKTHTMDVVRGKHRNRSSNWFDGCTGEPMDSARGGGKDLRNGHCGHRLLAPLLRPREKIGSYREFSVTRCATPEAHVTSTNV